jgi:5-methylthioribose kinase
LSDNDKDALNNIVDITFKLSALESFEPTVMHGDLNIRNIMTRGKQSITTEPRFRLIDINRFSRIGDVAYDIGELLVDLDQVSKHKDFAEIGRETNELIEAAFQKFMNERADATYEIRLLLSKARSLLKLTQLRASFGLSILGKNPISDQQAEKIYKEEILPNLAQVYSLISAVSSSVVQK